jgi:methyl-accepting chemotaxis protein
VDGTVALASLISLADGHLRKLSGFLAVLADGEGRSGSWERIREPLAALGRHNVPAALWFASPDGSYWTVPEGRAAGSLAGRDYFPKLMAGEAVTGALVVSKSTGRSVGIVAVPVRGQDGRIVGALGGSVYLDSLSLQLEREMSLPEDILFYAIDATPLGALHRDVNMIFTEPLKLGEDLSRAIREMQAQSQGIVSYSFMNSRRTMHYRKSPVTGWWYALGIVTAEHAPPGGP